MGCGSCSTGESGGGCAPKGCKNNGGCSTGGCNKLNVYDWLQHMQQPAEYQPFNIVEVRFKGSRKEFYRNEGNLELYTGDAVATESETGFDIGHVSISGDLVRLQLKKYSIPEDSERIRKIYRKATDRDLEKYEQLKGIEAKTLERARTIALELGLHMKLSDIEFQGDGKKVVFFYTAEERVDFRELIKRYAEEFRVRIEMRQIGYRQEASRLGGIGSCGRELCCSTWLTDFKAVTTSAARYQNLSINMLKLSGQCGRLKCCLNYELDTYMEALGEFPREDHVVIETESGRARSLKVDILRRMMWFVYEDSSEWIPVEVERVNKIIEMNKQGIKPSDLLDREKAAIALSRVTQTEDIIGDDSLTRFEEKRKERQKQGKNRGKNRERGERSERSGKPNNQGGGNKERSRGEKKGPSEGKPSPEMKANPEPQKEGEVRNRNRNNNRRRSNNRNRGEGGNQGPKDTPPAS